MFKNFNVGHVLWLAWTVMATYALFSHEPDVAFWSCITLANMYFATSIVLTKIESKADVIQS
jgi:hypothetical protein